MPITLDGTLGITTPALTVTGATVNTGGISTAGNLTFSSTGQRIIGDMSNATVANRLAFQTSTTNSTTVLTVIPSGTSTTAALNLETDSALTNASIFQLNQSISESRINSTIRGTGTYLPLTLYTGGSERMRITTTGNVGVGTSSPTTLFEAYGAAGFGYAFSVDQNVTRPQGSISLSGTNIASLATYTSAGNSTTVGQLYYYASIADGYARFLDIVAYGSTGGAAGNIRFLTGTATSTERMRIDGSGNVGIGVTPSYKLSVLGADSTDSNTVTTGSQAAILGTGSAHGIYARMKSSAGISGATYPNQLLGYGGGAFEIYTDSQIVFGTGGSSTERMRIDANGNVGIGTVSPTSKLHVVSGTKGLLVESGAGGYTAIGFNSTGGVSASFTTTTTELWLGSLNAGGTGSNGEIRVVPSTSTRLKINTNGEVTIPSQPAFFAIKTSANGGYTVGNPILFNVIPVNVGSNYSSSTGRFTAPVTGTYFFSMKNLQNNTDSVIRFYFYVNGTQADTYYGLSLSDGAYQSRFESTTGTYKEQQTSAILALNAGDYVTVVQKNGTASVDANGYSTFLGHLIG